MKSNFDKNEFNELSAAEKENVIKREIGILLVNFGIVSSLSGYNFLIECIYSYIVEKDFVRLSLSNEVYPQVAQKFNTLPTRIERSVRHAIERCFEKTLNNQLLDDIFGGLFTDKVKPTNKQFIMAIANYMKNTILFGAQI